MAALMMAQLAAVLRQSRAQGSEDDCSRACRIASAPITSASLRWLERVTTIKWVWRCGPLDCEIGLDQLLPADCHCLLWGAQRFAGLALERDEDASERIAAALRLGVGPGRKASVMITSPIKPKWFE